MRGLEVLQSLGVTAKVLQIENAKDPDEYVIKYGPEKFEKLIDNSITLVEFKINILKDKYNLNDTTEKIKFLTKIAEILSKVENNIERDIYVDKFSKEIGVGKEAIVAEIEKLIFKDKSNIKEWQNPRTVTNEKQIINSDTTSHIEEIIIYLLTQKNDEVYNILKEDIFIENINSEINRELIRKLYEQYEKGNISNIDITSICELDEEFSVITEILMKENINEDTLKLAKETANTFKINILQNKKDEIIKRIKNSSTEEERSKLEKELNEIIFALAKK